MNYYIVFLLQAILPISLLLGINWLNYQNIKLKSIIGLSLLGLICGVMGYLQLPTNQQIKLGLNLFLMALFVLFYLVHFFHSIKFAYFCQFMLCLAAGMLWARDPNISAITNTDVINTDFILHLSAVIFALIFCFLFAFWLYLLLKQTKIAKKCTALPFLLISLTTLFLLLPLTGEVLLGLMKLQVIDLTKARLSFVAKSSNLISYTNYFIAALTALSLIFFTIKIHFANKAAVKQTHQPIEKRKKLAILQTSQRTLLWGGIALCTMLSAQLYWDQIASRPPQLSKAKVVTLDKQNRIHIPIEQVKDGKLHRFVWIASDGKAVRFFIINRSTKTLSLAAVFDACILCGDQGYVMEGDQVVCVGCGVRMFIPSIGKPGGCNPVPIEDWQQTDTDIIISKKSLEDGLNYFSTIVELDVKDPVDGTTLKNTTAEHKYNYAGKTYFFANEQNLNAFRDHPENYVAKEENP
ncbi:Fe-S-containing protein [Avibacterium sp. 20-129]|uniref:Fe-S-containing protein n=1 Tax=Avibacterium sp. 20-129 TaxID=2911525 RepID=UPI002246ABC2|nr:Fe-S-containing protein [Avibacterium sp. 20-129]MCW9697853.1 Fe-S-containing protein [Avibacterium sp. 20-129]